MSKFGDAHGFKQKITAGTFDMKKRRLVTAGEDGSVKIWNFSNGHSLKNLVGADDDSEQKAMAALRSKNEEKKGFEQPSQPMSMQKKKRYEYT